MAYAKKRKSKRRKTKKKSSSRELVVRKRKRKTAARRNVPKRKPSRRRKTTSKRKTTAKRRVPKRKPSRRRKTAAEHKLDRLIEYMSKKERAAKAKKRRKAKKVTRETLEGLFRKAYARGEKEKRDERIREEKKRRRREEVRKKAGTEQTRHKDPYAPKDWSKPNVHKGGTIFLEEEDDQLMRSLSQKVPVRSMGLWPEDVQPVFLPRLSQAMKAFQNASEPGDPSLSERINTHVARRMAGILGSGDPKAGMLAPKSYADLVIAYGAGEDFVAARGFVAMVTGQRVSHVIGAIMPTKEQIEQSKETHPDLKGLGYLLLPSPLSGAVVLLARLPLTDP